MSAYASPTRGEGMEQLFKNLHFHLKISAAKKGYWVILELE
jgi:hypothetical protein